MREGGIFNHLATLEPRHFSQLVALMDPSLSQIHHYPSLFFFFFHRSRHARFTTEQELDREEVAVGLKL